MTSATQSFNPSINRTQAGEISARLFVIRDGKKLENSRGESDLISFLRGFEVYESIVNPCMEMRLVLEDSAGLIGGLTGTEEFQLEIQSSIQDRTYRFRSYHIQARVRTNQTNETYLVNCVSDEYVRNEITNVFGNSLEIFKKGTEASQIIRELLGKKYLNSGKKFIFETTLNKQSFISPNWRPFDLIYWMSQRAIRRKGKGQKLQNGFAFFETAAGFNFKSIDTMIEDVGNQRTQSKTSLSAFNTPDRGSTFNFTPELYEYTYTPKRSGNEALDQFSIDRITFPDEKNYLMGLRHGSWSGYSVGFDPTFITRSKMGLSTDLSADAYRYAMTDLWSRMAHLNKGAKNPMTNMDKNVQNYMNYPKRVRYEMIPNQIFDPKFKNNPQRNYEQLIELQAYQWMRIESLKQVQLTIIIPGNLDLYAGSGVRVIIPSSEKGATTKLDERYSGTYLIAAVAHKSTGGTMQTELALMKDSYII